MKRMKNREMLLDPVIWGAIMFLVGLIGGAFLMSPNLFSQTLGVLAEKYSGALTALATFVLAIITWRYISLTRELISKQERPKILVTLQKEIHPSHGEQINLVIQNFGLGPAYSIDFDIEPNDCEYLEGKTISSIGPFKKGLQFFAPNQKKHFYLGQLRSIKEKLGEKEIKITAKFTDNSKSTHIDISFVSLALMESFEYSLKDISGKLSLIEGAIREEKQAVVFTSRRENQ